MRLRLNSKGVGGQRLGGLIELPRASKMAGLQLGGDSISWLALGRNGAGVRVISHGRESIPEQVFSGGVIRDTEGFIESLRVAKKALRGVSVAHLALPEDISYICSVQIPEGATPETVRHLVEFELQNRLDTSLEHMFYDFEEVGGSTYREVAVGAFPRALVEEYVDAFAQSGIAISSVEIGMRAASRAVSSPDDSSVSSLLIEIEPHRAIFSTLKGDVPISMSSVALEGSLDHIAHALAETVLEYQHLALKKSQHEEYTSPLSRIILIGSAAQDTIARALAEHTAIPAAVGDVWGNEISFGEHVPSISKDESQGYAAAVGLLVRAFGEQR